LDPREVTQGSPDLKPRTGEFNVRGGNGSFHVRDLEVVPKKKGGGHHSLGRGRSGRKRHF